MTALGRALSDYLTLRRRLGYALERDQPQLEHLVCFLEQAGAERITTELALRWARIPGNQHPIIWRRRLSMVRQFARYLATIDPASEIPSKDLLPAHQPRVAPYIYSPQEIARVMAAARGLRRPLTAALFETVIGLIDGQHRRAATRGARTGPLGRRPARRRARHPRRQEPAAARGRAAPERHRRARALRSRARRALPQPRTPAFSSPPRAGGRTRPCSGRRFAR